MKRKISAGPLRFQVVVVGGDVIVNHGQSCTRECSCGGMLRKSFYLGLGIGGSGPVGGADTVRDCANKAETM